MAGENPLLLDSRTPNRKVKDYLQQQTRFQMLTKSKPEDARRLWEQAQQDVEVRYRFYEYMSQRKFDKGPEKEPDKKSETTPATKAVPAD